MTSQGAKILKGSRIRFRTGDMNTDEYLDKIKEKRYRQCKDILTDWIKNNNKGKGSVTNANKIKVNNRIYKVDGQKVKIEPKPNEIRIAKLLSGKYGCNVELLPVIKRPAYKKTPDYRINGIKYDLKTKTKDATGKNTIYDSVRTSIEQANNFIIDLTDTSLSKKQVKEQIDKIFWSDHTISVERVMIIVGDEITNVYRRNN